MHASSTFVSAMIAPPSPSKRRVPVVVGGTPRSYGTGNSVNSNSSSSRSCGSSSISSITRRGGGGGAAMPSAAPEDTYTRPSVHRCLDPIETGKQAAAFAAETIRVAVAKQRSARVVFSVGASQEHFWSSLTEDCEVPWNYVTVFALNEFVGVSATDRSSCQHALTTKLLSRLTPAPREVLVLNGTARDLNAECARYGALLEASPIDLTCLSIEENGHLGFNTPPTCGFWDSESVKVVELDPPSRQQLLRERSSNSQSNLDHGEGGKGKEQKREQPLFSTLAAVPTQALSLTIPAIMRSRVLSCVATGGNEAGASGTGGTGSGSGASRVALAVAATLQGCPGTPCLASSLRTHNACELWLDPVAASQLHAPSVRLYPRAFPGFVDLQANGYNGVNFSTVSTVSEAKIAMKGLLASGCAAILPTVVSSSLFAYQLCLPILATAIEKSPEFENRVLGLHLMGPFYFMQENISSGGSSTSSGMTSSGSNGNCDFSSSSSSSSGSGRNSLAHLEEILQLARGHVKLITVTIADTTHAEWPSFCSTAQEMGVATVLLEGQLMTSTAEAGTAATAEVKSPAAKAMAALTAGAAIAAGVEGGVQHPAVAAVPEADALTARTAAVTMAAQLDDLAEDGISGFSTLGRCLESVPVALGSTPALEWATLPWDGGTRVPLHVAQAVSNCKTAVLVSDGHPLIGPGLSGVKQRATDFKRWPRVDYRAQDYTMRCSATGAVAGSALTLLEIANLAVGAPEKGGLGLTPYEVVDWAYSRPLRLLSLDPSAFELEWAAKRRSRSGKRSDKNGDVVALANASLTVSWSEDHQAFQITSS